MLFQHCITKVITFIIIEDYKPINEINLLKGNLYLLSITKETILFIFYLFTFSELCFWF